MKVANEKNVCHISLLNCLSLSLWENFLDDPPPNFHSWFWQKIDCSAPILHFWFGPKVNCAQYCVNLERDFRQFFAVMRDYWSFGNHQTASPPARSNCCWKMCLFSWCTYYSQKYSHFAIFVIVWSSKLWQYWLWSFQGKDTKLEMFLAKNQL